MAEFPRLFIKVAVPKLRHQIHIAGLRIALDELEWGEAVADLTATARRYGLTHLPGDAPTQTIEWITSVLLKTIDAAEIIVADERAISNKIMRDLRSHFQWCAAQ